jgi:hypothetical protein
MQAARSEGMLGRVQDEIAGRGLVMRSKSFFTAIFVAVLALSAAAQSPPTRIRGTVEKLDGQTLVVKSRDGQSVSIGLAPNFTVRAVVAKTVADIKPGDFVASTSVKGQDGKLRAIEVHILPESLRGVAREGQFPWDLAPDSLMTNATAAQITSAPQGQVIKVTYKDGEAEVTIPPGTPIVGYVAGDPSLLKPGAAVFIIAQKSADGSLTASGVTAEKDGVKPPM